MPRPLRRECCAQHGVSIRHDLRGVQKASGRNGLLQQRCCPVCFMSTTSEVPMSMA